MERERKLKVEYLPITSLKAYTRNPRAHSPKQCRQLAESIREFGFTVPILIDGNSEIVAGHARLEAAKLIGLERVPTICLANLTEGQKRAYTIADNKLAENASWNLEFLAGELRYLSNLDLDFELGITGFEAAEIDMLIQGLDTSESGDAVDEVQPIDRLLPSVTLTGDLWILGGHRLLCADATKLHSFEHLLDRNKAQMGFVDPPYNVPIEGHVCGSGAIHHREFAMASGEMSETAYIDFLRTIFRNLVTFSSNGSIHFICIDWRHLWEMLSSLRDVYAEIKNICVWNKDNGGLGSLYRSKYELIIVAKNGAAPHINNVELGRFGRNRTNVWNYPGANSLREGRRAELAMHPTVKPVAMVADAILDCSKRGGVVLDCFGGSGTTLIAAEKTGRHARLMELDPAYVDLIIRRFKKLTGLEAAHGANGHPFSDIERERSRPDGGEIKTGERRNKGSG
jgi:DNA modification methylase